METVPQASFSFRQEHVHILEELARFEVRFAFPPIDAAGRKELMQEFSHWLDRRVRTHAEWEEEHLYSLVDTLARSSPERPYTTSMRYEHRILARLFAELLAEAARPAADFVFYARRAWQLIGLFRAHVEEEDATLLSVIDDAMSEKDFLRFLTDDAPHPD